MTITTFYNHAKFVSISQPTDVGAAAIAPKFASLRNYQSGFLLVTTGTIADSPVLQIRQAKTISGSGIKALEVDRYAKNTPGSSPQEQEDMLQLTDSAVSTIALAANTTYVIPIRPGMLDVQNDFDCVGAEVEDPGSGSNIVGIQLVLMDGPKGITDNTDHIPSARVNQMPNNAQ